MEKVKSVVYALHSKYNFNSLFGILLFLSNVFYFYYLLAIAYHNTLFLDDYLFLAQYHSNGLFKSVAWWYNNWQGRFSAQLATNFTVSSYDAIHTLLPYTILLTALFIYSIYRILQRTLSNLNEPTRLPFFLIFNFSFFFFNLCVISNFEFSTFFWINVSTMYFGGIVFSLLGIGEMISSSRKVWSYMLVALGFLYAGSSSEHFGAICTMLLFLYCVVLYYVKKKQLRSFLADVAVQKALVALVFCLIAFGLMILAPGTAVRRSTFSHTTVSGAFFIALKSLSFFVQQLLITKLKYLLILALPFAYLGTLLRKVKTVDEFKIAAIILFSVPLFVVFLYICMLPNAYAISDMGPTRALTHITFYIAIYIAVISFLIGYKTLFPKKIAFILSVFSCICFMFISRDRIIGNLPDTIKYTQSEKARINKLISLKEHRNTKPVFLDSLYSTPNNALAYYEIGHDSTAADRYWINKAVRSALGLDFEIWVKKTGK